MIVGYLEDILYDLSVSSVISSFKILRREVSDEEGYIRIKCDLSNGDIFEFAEFIIIVKNKIHIGTYSFRWQTPDKKLIKRWDNVRHYKDVSTFPYHLHISPDKAIASEPMTLKRVLKHIEKCLPAKDEE